MGASHVVLAAGAALVLAAAGAGAQTRLDAGSAEELVNALSRPADAAPPASHTRSMGRIGTKAPDADTNLCVDPGNQAPAAQAAGGARRSLYVTSAPKVDLDVRFGLDSAVVAPASEQLLDALGKALNDPQLRPYRFVIAGHTDQRGSDAYNKSLSCERALAVRAYLIRKFGVEPERLIALGFGFDKLLDPADPLAEVNRRVEIRRY